MPDPKDTTINNAGSNPDGETQRSGGSPNDPDGGHELLGREWKGPDPDPISELVPGGQGAEAPPYSHEDLVKSQARSAAVSGTNMKSTLAGSSTVDSATDDIDSEPGVQRPG
jgi:hypothetical protein